MRAIEFIIVSTILAVITILGLLGTIHLTINICGCRRICRKSRKRRSLRSTTILSGKTHTLQISQYADDMDDDYDDDGHNSRKSLASKTNLVCVLTVICFQIFLFVSCYQQSLIAYATHNIVQCRVLFCMIAFYVYGKMLLYCYFVCRAYNMLENSQLNYSKRTVVVIVCIYFVMMSSILFGLIYVHFTDDYCVENMHAHYTRQRTLVCAALGLIDVAMAMMSVSLLVQKLFALVRGSMTVRGFSKITPHPSPLPTPTTLRATSRSNSVMRAASGVATLQQQQSHSYSQHRMSTTTLPRDLHRLSSSSFTPTSERKLSLKSRINNNNNTQTANAVLKTRTPSPVTMQHQQQQQRQNMSGNESASGGEESQMLEQTPEHFKMPRTRTGTEDLKECDDDDDDDEDELQSIVSNEILMDVDINKVKKLSIGQLMQEPELMQLTQTQTTENSGDDDDDDGDDDDGRLKAAHDRADHNGVDATPETTMMVLDDDDEDDDDADDDEDEMKESSPIMNMKSNPSKQRRTHHQSLPSSSSATKALNIEIGATPCMSPRRSVMSQSAQSMSLERRTSSILELVRRRSEIASTISNQHIARFHQHTMYDNEMLLLSTKLLILLTVCVISSFCAFLLLFVVIRFNPNNGIFFVYGVDAFVNIWCLAFTFKFSNHCYNILFNCGDAQRCTKCCFPLVKTAALTWKCCSKNVSHVGHVNGTRRQSEQNEQQQQQKNRNVNEGKTTSSCHINCCFCLCGNEQELQIYVMAKGEVKMMVDQNRKLYQ